MLGPKQNFIYSGRIMASAWEVAMGDQLHPLNRYPGTDQMWKEVDITTVPRRYGKGTNCTPIPMHQIAYTWGFSPGN